jgi:hypothetical protein
MAAGPRDTPQGRDAATGHGMPEGSPEPREHPGFTDSHASREPLDGVDADEPLDRLGSVDRLEPLAPLEEFEPLDSADALADLENGQSFRELRPARRLRIWQLAPITALAVGGSLMFAFPLAFESGDAGPVVAMLGLLLCLCAAGWGLMAARRAGQTWPGLPPRGSGARPDWRYVTGYTLVIVLLALLAVWRVARLR